MTRGAPRKWKIVVANPGTVAFAQDAFPDPQGLTILKEWFAFCRLNPGHSKSMTLKLYASQQMLDETKATSVHSRLECLKWVSHDPSTEEAALDRCRTAGVAKTIQGLAKTRFKANLPLHSLLRPLVPTAVRARDRRYQCLWWALLSTGARPAHVKGSKINILNGSAFRVLWGSRKKRSKPMSRPLDYAMPCGVDTVVSDELQRCVDIGTKKNIASCINSWLQKWMAKHHRGAPRLTSTLPRVHVDNLLRARVQAGTLSVHDFEVMMDHTMQTSDEHYCSDILI